MTPALAGTGCAGAPVDTRSYDCEQGGLLSVEIADAMARVEFDGRRHTLAAVETDEGRRWRDGDVLLWIRDGEASVTVGDQVVVWGCRRR
ncbi:MliC family protein [Lentisalinibacter salinarum]|uniref:MliC family protein n=1 Tax=Lentisalinibacter salinarum TaxID=2992239 RepID=UPI0038691E8F